MISNISEKKYFYLKVFRVAYFLLLNSAVIGLNLIIQSNNPLFPKTLFYFLAIATSTYIGGAFSGILSTVLTGLSLIFIYNLTPYPDKLSFIFILSTFMIEGYALSLIIDRLRHTDIISRLEDREKILITMLADKQKLLAKAQEEVRARDEFLSIASHELKTPLTSMLLQLQLILHNIRNVSLARFSVKNLMTLLENAESQTKRLSKMINDLLNVSLITSGRLNLEKEEVNLSELVSDVVEKSSPKLDGKQITIEAEKEVIGHWDKIRLEQVIINLLSNAVKYGDSKPIKIIVQKQDSVARLTVEDQGIGIPQDKKEIIFKRFKRGVSEKDYKGLGVGLYIVHQIVKAHDGKIDLKSKPDQGSTFIVELPIQKKIDKS